MKQCFKSDKAGVKTNFYGVNEAIKFKCLAPKDMVKAGFSDGRNHKLDYWYACWEIPGLESIYFSVRIPKPYALVQELDISTIDEDFGQPLEWQSGYCTEDVFQKCQSFIELKMGVLQSLGILSGHIPGEYI